MPGSYAPGGQVNLVAVASPGEVVVNQAGETPSVDVSSIREFGDISLSDFSIVDVSGFETGEVGAGTIIIRGGNLQMTTAASTPRPMGLYRRTRSVSISLSPVTCHGKGSSIYAQTGGYDGAGTGDGGAVSSRQEISDAGGFHYQHIHRGAGNSGNITVNVEKSLTLLPYSEISSNTVQTGRGGDIAVTAKNVTIAGDQASIDGKPLDRHRCTNVRLRAWRVHNNQGRQPQRAGWRFYLY